MLARDGELAPLLLDLAEQARVLDRQHGLVGEGLHQVDRAGLEGRELLPEKDKGSEPALGADQRNDEGGSEARGDGDVAQRPARRLQQIRHDDRPPLVERAPHRGLVVADRQPPDRLDRARRRVPSRARARRCGPSARSGTARNRPPGPSATARLATRSSTRARSRVPLTACPVSPSVLSSSTERASSPVRAAHGRARPLRRGAEDAWRDGAGRQRHPRSDARARPDRQPRRGARPGGRLRAVPLRALGPHLLALALDGSRRRGGRGDPAVANPRRRDRDGGARSTSVGR